MDLRNMGSRECVLSSTESEWVNYLIGMLLRRWSGRKMQAGPEKMENVFTQGTYLPIAWALKIRICLDLMAR